MASSHPTSSPFPAQQSAESSAPDWGSRPLGELIRHIIDRHHTWLRAELSDTSRLIRRAVDTGGRERSRSLIEMGKLFQRFQRDLEDHLKKEEVVLFPLIERLEQASAAGSSVEQNSFGAIRNPVRFMMQDHELTDRLLAKIKELAVQTDASEASSSARQDILEHLKALEADLATHVYLEDQILFPRAILLDERGKAPAV